ncbi:MAG: hypothetical protein IJY79_00105 [Clostridia bacterium]|nr:hypothetical protein [Clostridia bacterium]
MISYIFKNKTKNILMIVFTVLYIISSDFFTGFYYSITRQIPISFYEISGVVAFALILVYMFTLKRQYRLKEWLFPVAFAILTAMSIYSLVTNIVYHITSQQYHYFMYYESITSYASYVFAIIAYVFCFIGSIKNFKNDVFLKIGVIIKIVGTVLTTVIAVIMEFIAMGGMEYFENIDETYRTYVYGSMFQTVVKWILSLFFFVGILLLTSNKKSEYIDITPYVEERKAKKEAKKAARLEAKQQEEAKLNAPVPEIPDGSWRCMACGKILPDSENKCDCGYKK